MINIAQLTLPAVAGLKHTLRLDSRAINPTPTGRLCNQNLCYNAQDTIATNQLLNEKYRSNERYIKGLQTTLHR